MTAAVLGLVQDKPLRTLAAGDPLFTDDDPGALVAVLVSGALEVVAGGAVLNRMDVPGAFVGEIGALLGVARTAVVVAAGPTQVRLIGDPEAFFHDHPELGLELARQLAGRLHRLTAYLADVREQYADRDDHLGFVDSVLVRIASRPAVQVQPGSVRSPDY